MEKRVLGRTGWEVSAISFGGIKLPRARQKQCTEVLNKALDLGINFIDTEECAECEQCIEKCPYELDIPRLLKRAAEVLVA